MDLIVLDETGRHEDVREQVDSILALVAPLVKPTTGLDLPGLVAFRIVPVETWQSEQTATMARRLLTYQELRPFLNRPGIALLGTVMLRKFRQLSADLGGVMVMAATQPGPGADESQTLLVPEALEHTGVLSDPQFLTQVVVHELVHHAQNRASGHRTNWTERTPKTLLGGKGVSLLEEGHARWADQVITRDLFDTAVDADSAPKSESYKEVAKRKELARLKTKINPYKVGRALVASAIETVGTQELNAVWSNPLLLPSKDEVADAVAALAADKPTRPKLWASRLGSATFTDAGVRSSAD
ncbi:zinc-dependent metalloprotease [Streptomyces sp. NPDC026589]|uniref:zinc-dependent metalloprotease n=1 Tax=Streptomyces TaxID=1883 RepID=UPI0033EE1BD4|nr:zinc-dependent metalloprotease [Streptomyces anulatus]